MVFDPLRSLTLTFAVATNVDAHNSREGLMEVETAVDGEAARRSRSRRGWMLMGVGMGAALLLSACGKKNKNDDDDD